MGATAPSKRELNRTDKRARITVAARALFTTKGFAATTTKEVARAAGVAAGTVFTYAATKEDLLILVFHDEMLDVVTRSHEGADALTGSPTVERLMKFFAGLIDYHAEDMDLARALMRELGYVGGNQSKALVDELMKRILDNLTGLLSTAVESPSLKRSTARSTARVVFATYYLHLGSWLNAVIERPRFERILREDLTTFIAPARSCDTADHRRNATGREGGLTGGARPTAT